ncbi:MAG: strictosidine synthase [Proteobacteria bacterium]|nr:strictosidine synthase [Pseudomonadota bacterium]
MFDSLKAATDRLLGRGSAAITVPVMDGAFKPNRVLDDARVVAEMPGIDDLASDGDVLWASAGPVLHRIGDDGKAVEARRFDAEITALAVRRGNVAVALGGRRIDVIAPDGSTASLSTLVGRPLACVNALAYAGDDELVFSDGSQRNGPEAWCRDLMELGRGGRAGRWSIGMPMAAELAHGLRYAYGILPQGDGVLVSESWRHRVVQTGGKPVLSELPGYPSRMTPASGGGWWLTCFVCRTQLVEFVLREKAYRERMLAEIDPRYWIAPALASGRSFLEPLQGAGVKQMGVLKPWAPPRSYGLVLRVDAQGQVAASLHSQVDGRHHGITAVAEHRGRLYVASKGSGRLLVVDPKGVGA